MDAKEEELPDGVYPAAGQNQEKGKWSILKSAFVGSNSILDDTRLKKNSIHRHQGFEMFSRDSKIWIPTVGLKISSRTNADNVTRMIYFVRPMVAESLFLGVLFSAYGKALVQCVQITQELCRSGCGKLVKINTGHSKQHSNMLIELLFYPPKDYFEFLWSSSKPHETSSSVNADLCKAAKMEGPFTLATYNLKSQCQVMFRERPERKKLSLKELSLMQPAFLDKLGIKLNNSDVLELGGGMTGLAGIGIAVQYPKTHQVIISDGNPDSVLNQKLCIHLNEETGNIPKGKVKCCHLMWDKEDKSGAISELLHQHPKGFDHSELLHQHPKGFDLIIAADCLFFQDFHEDLKHVLSLLLAKNGQILLLQPTRGESMNNFMDIAQGVFTMELLDEYE
eukprot:CAMPEP_0117811482 /NCGR_PEP_ID=MMETSP0948-20121206/22160_1 /TAXON_ID=44440 /ORGANISM="Chattonella subsalsa, Strain CCMP2191" /LENGTH=393 /DNA_ID=CAMNT_0005648097 /DNA_START=15 /DNA_END=1192 /DNA_ORIENTATION=+